MEAKMKYPVLIHKENNSEFGVTVPDIPGCFTCGETLEEALKNLQDAVECYYEGETACAPPIPSSIETLMNNHDFYTDGGFWVLTDIDFSFLSKKTIRVNITMPEYKLIMIDRAAKAHGLSRSAFLMQAAERMAMNN